MKRAFWVTLVVTMGIGLAGSMLTARAQQPANRFAAFDKGPATIDVSTYLPEMQSAYLVFTKKCSACHTVARAINSDFVLEGEWEADVHEMATRAGKAISEDEAKQIYDFLVYDSKIRKADFYEQRQRQVAAASPILTEQPSLDPTSTGRRLTIPSPQVIAAFDKGPAKIDVSNYPPELKKSYQVFTKKCGLCHTPARAINSDRVLEADWETDVNDMVTRAGRLMTADDAKQIYEFLVYDSKFRKADLYRERQLYEASKLTGGAGARK
jgi:hypothetical protein